MLYIHVYTQLKKDDVRRTQIRRIFHAEYTLICGALTYFLASLPYNKIVRLNIIFFFFFGLSINISQKLPLCSILYTLDKKLLSYHDFMSGMLKDEEEVYQQ